ncbi:MAG: alpha/beta hydrolase [Actinobacteria bacterium]|nr:alpha/beta hydrolase [Actinomycetota bacterium]
MPAPRTHVVFVHGALDRATSFERTRRHLADVDTTTYDRRGYGRAVDADPPARTFEDHVDDLLARLDARPTVLVGHSLGGNVALTAAVRRPEVVRAVVTYEAPMPWEPWWPSDTAGGAAVQAGDAARAAEVFMRRMIGDQRWQRLPERTKEARRREGVALLADLAGLRAGRPFDPADVRVPVVVGVGSESRPHQKDAAPRLVASLPDAELVVIEGASHGAHLSHPAEFAGLARRALARL